MIVSPVHTGKKRIIFLVHTSRLELDRKDWSTETDHGEKSVCYAHDFDAIDCCSQTVSAAR